MTTQHADYPRPICSERFPQYNFTVIPQYNSSTGKSHYFFNLSLQGDPAALQALRDIEVSVDSDRRYFTPANQFVS